MSTHDDAGNTGPRRTDVPWNGEGRQTEVALSPVSVAADQLRHLADELLIMARRDGIAPESRIGLWLQEARLSFRAAADTMEEGSATHDMAVAAALETLDAQVARVRVAEAEMREQTRLLEQTRVEGLLGEATRRVLDMLPAHFPQQGRTDTWAGALAAAPVRTAALVVVAFGLGAGAFALHRWWTDDAAAVQAQARIVACQTVQLRDARTGEPYCPLRVLLGQP